MSTKWILNSRKLKNWFLIASAFVQNIVLARALPHRQWSLSPNKNSERPSSQIPNFSVFLSIIILLPIATAFAAENDFFSVEEESEDSLFQLRLEAQEDFIEVDDYNTEGLSLIEIDEADESLIPWELDALASDEITSYVEKKALELTEEFDDVYAYGMPVDRNQYEPTYEKVPEMEKKLFTRPRIVPLNPDQIASEPSVEQVETPKVVEAPQEYVQPKQTPMIRSPRQRRVAPKASMATKEMVIQMPVKKKRK